MLSYILKRILLMIPTLLGIMLMTFAVIQFAPGGPVEQVIARITGQLRGPLAEIRRVEQHQATMINWLIGAFAAALVLGGLMWLDTGGLRSLILASDQPWLPVVVLLAWTMVMWVWMYATRIPAMLKAGIDAKGMVGSTGASLRAQLPDNVSWKADNYNHLHEAPTLFYAVAIVLAIIGQGDGFNTTLAWAYVALRVVHSLVQATVNKVQTRFLLFLASTLCLIGLAIRALLATL